LVSVSNCQLATTRNFNQREIILGLAEPVTAGIANANKAQTVRPAHKIKRAPHLFLQGIVRPGPFVDLPAHLLIQRAVRGNDFDGRYRRRHSVKEGDGAAVHLARTTETSSVEVVAARSDWRRSKPL
jgi:hypothetical protein